MERAARHVLFEDLQREWSDAMYTAERDRLELQDAEDKEDACAWARGELAVVRVEDRLEGFDPAHG